MRKEISSLLETDPNATKRFRLLRQLNSIESVFEKIDEMLKSNKSEDLEEDEEKFVDLKLRRRRKDLTAPGTCLVSHPLQLADPSYRRKVMILLSEDTTNGTSLGVVVNGNRSQTSADRLISDHKKKTSRRTSKEQFVFHLT